MAKAATETGMCAREIMKTPSNRATCADFHVREAIGALLLKQPAFRNDLDPCDFEYPTQMSDNCRPGSRSSLTSYPRWRTQTKTPRQFPGGGSMNSLHPRLLAFPAHGGAGVTCNKPRRNP